MGWKEDFDKGTRERVNTLRSGLKTEARGKALEKKTDKQEAKEGYTANVTAKYRRANNLEGTGRRKQINSIRNHQPKKKA